MCLENILHLYIQNISVVTKVSKNYNMKISGQNYDWSSVMTSQISNLTKQSFSEICRINQSLNETIWTLKCDRLDVFDMVEEMKKKKFVNWIFSLHAAKVLGSIPQYPNLETCFCLIFITTLLYRRNFFPEYIILSWGCRSRFKANHS